MEGLMRDFVARQNNNTRAAGPPPRDRYPPSLLDSSMCMDHAKILKTLTVA